MANKKTKRPAKIHKPVAMKVKEQLPLPGVISLTKKTALQLWTNKKLFGTILAIYAVLFLVFVQGLRTGTDVAAFKGQYANPALGSMATYVQLVSTSALDSTAGSGVYQLFLFVFVSLALIWALQKLKNKESPRARDAYYKGMYPIIPFMLILLVIFVQLLPVLVGLNAYQTITSTGVSATVYEQIIIGLLVLGLGFLSLFFIASSVFALFVVAQPDQTPLNALRQARTLVRSRRWVVLRKIAFLPLVSVVVTAVVSLPFILVLPVIAETVLAIGSIITIAFAYSYLFNIYVGLQND